MTDYTDTLDLTAPGPLVVRGMPAKVYHALPRLNAGKVAAFAESTLQGVVACEQPIVPTMAMKLGTAAHARILEPDDFACRSEEFEDIGPASAAKMAEIEAANPDTIVLARGWRAQIDAMRAAIRRSAFSEKLIFEGGGAKELTVLWTETVHGQPVPCKARIDFIDIPNRVVGDYKTTADASPGAFERTIGDLGYHTKAAWYCRAVTAAGLMVNPRMVWIAAETKPPFTCQPFVASDRLMDQGWAEACVGMHRYAAWKAGRPDPMPPPPLMTVDLPVWKQIDPDTLHEFVSQHQ